MPKELAEKIEYGELKIFEMSLLEKKILEDAELANELVEKILKSCAESMYDPQNESGSLK